MVGVAEREAVGVVVVGEAEQRGERCVQVRGREHVVDQQQDLPAGHRALPRREVGADLVQRTAATVRARRLARVVVGGGAHVVHTEHEQLVVAGRDLVQRRRGQRGVAGLRGAARALGRVLRERPDRRLQAETGGQTVGGISIALVWVTGRASQHQPAHLQRAPADRHRLVRDGLGDGCAAERSRIRVRNEERADGNVGARPVRQLRAGISLHCYVVRASASLWERARRCPPWAQMGGGHRAKQRWVCAGGSEQRSAAEQQHVPGGGSQYDRTATTSCFTCVEF